VFSTSLFSGGTNHGMMVSKKTTGSYHKMSKIIECEDITLIAWVKIRGVKFVDAIIENLVAA
jgi:hypothetical protein